MRGSVCANAIARVSKQRVDHGNAGTLAIGSSDQQHVGGKIQRKVF
jgi:hypothetical protein